MKVVTLKDIPNMPVEGAAEPIEGGTGSVSRSRQTILQPGESANYNCSVVNFSQGCTTGWHTHNCDQLLIVTSGSGMVATEHEKREINVGDVVQIKAGERHWHGAKADSTMGHITITLAGSQATHGYVGSSNSSRRTVPRHQALRRYGRQWRGTRLPLSEEAAQYRRSNPVCTGSVSQ